MILVGLLGNLVLKHQRPRTRSARPSKRAPRSTSSYGAALAVMGGVVFWAPKLWGRTMPDKQVLPLALLGVLGTILAALPLYIAGLPRPGGWHPGQRCRRRRDPVARRCRRRVRSGSSCRWSVTGWSRSRSSRSSGSWSRPSPVEVSRPTRTRTARHTIEWSTPSPAPADNYEHVATVASADTTVRSDPREGASREHTGQLALPPAAPPAPRRQVLVGTALGVRRRPRC